MVTLAAKIFGAVFLLIGVLGFVPMFTPDGYLLGLFHVNTAHNLVHLASGVVALLAGFGNYKSSKLYFQVFGVVYGLVAVLGFIYGDEPLLGIVASNMGDTVLHIAIAAVSLYLGFGIKEDGDAAATTPKAPAAPTGV